MVLPRQHSKVGEVDGRHDFKGNGVMNMGIAAQSELDNAVIDAKKKFRDDEILDVLKGCTVGGKAANMDLKVGEKFEPSANK